MPDHFVVGSRRIAARVVLLRMKDEFSDESWPRVERRTARELRTLGLEVMHIGARAKEMKARLAELGAQAAKHNALAAVRVVRDGRSRRADVWLYDALTGKMLLRQIKLESQRSQRVGHVATQVVDLLHASLTEIRLPGWRQRNSKRHVPKVATKLVERQLSRPPGQPPKWQLQGGIAVGASPGGLGPGLAARITAGYNLTRWLALSVLAGIPLMGNEVERADGQSRVWPFELAASLAVEPWRNLDWSPGLWLGIGGWLVYATGAADAPREGLRTWGSTALLSIGTRLAYRVAQPLRVIVGVRLGVAMPQLRLRFGEEIAARGGRPLIDGTLALEWGW